MKELAITKQEYIKILGVLLDLKQKEIDVLECMLDNDTTDRNVISEKLELDVRVVSNYKTKLVKKKLIKDDIINPMVKLDKLILNVNT